MNYKVEGIWKPFGKDNYKWAWHDKKAVGVLKCFWKDLKYSHQRLRKGYCDYDLFSIYDWFLAVMPVMLQEYKDSRIGSPGELGENYPDEHGIMQNDTCHKEWDEILDRMIFLFQEADESTCKRLNPFDDEASRIYDEFDEKYGFFGEKLQTGRRRRRNARRPGTRLCTSLESCQSIKMPWKGTLLRRRICGSTERSARMRHSPCLRDGFITSGTDALFSKC